MKTPIQVKAHDKFPYKLVEWKLHDKCNYDCSFCGDEHKLGVVGWADLDTNKTIVDSIINSAEGQPVWIQITGGEPTLYPKFFELVKYIKEKGAYVGLLTNGSRTVRWWKQFQGTELIDMMWITFHSQQQADYKHIAEISNLFLNDETIVINVATYTADTIDYLLEGVEYLKQNTGSYVSTNAMDFGENNMLTPEHIGQEKFDKLLNHFNLAVGDRFEQEKKKTTIPLSLIPVRMDTSITYDDQTVEDKDVTQMMKLGENRFKGWLCYAGMDSMNIENGVKYRGGCKRDPTPFTSETLAFFDKPFVCDVEDCYCAMDMITTKIRISD